MLIERKFPPRLLDPDRGAGSRAHERRRRFIPCSGSYDRPTSLRMAKSLGNLIDAHRAHRTSHHVFPPFVRGGQGGSARRALMPHTSHRCSSRASPSCALSTPYSKLMSLPGKRTAQILRVSPKMLTRAQIGPHSQFPRAAPRLTSSMVCFNTPTNPSTLLHMRLCAYF